MPTMKLRLPIVAFSMLALACLLGLTTKPAAKRVVFVFDASLSMKPHFAPACDQVAAAVKELPADGQFAIVIDIGEVQQRFPHSGYAAAADNQKAAAERFLRNDKLVPKGEGRLDSA